jgi:aminoglycoside phosphotransferase family enzyme
LASRSHIIDRLEFNRELRLVDPFDELARLALECAMLGARWDWSAADRARA